MAIVTLTTDFGLRDSYVAEVKGVLLSLVPSLQIVDITHEVKPFSVEQGAFQLLRSYKHFPESACHLAVVDPGVGTDRSCLFIKTAHGIFLGPDNGLLKWAVEESAQKKKRKPVIYQIPVPPKVLPTFHARDIFAPCLGAYLRGRKLRLKRIDQMVGLDFPKNSAIARGIRGRVLYTDHYGNCVTSVLLGELPVVTGEIKKHQLSVYPNYQAIPQGKAGLVRGSHGYWEVAARCASAERLLQVSIGDSITMLE